MNIIGALRTFKHRAFRATRPARLLYYDLTEPLVQAWHRRFPYHYDPSDFTGTFVTHDEPLTRTTTEPVPRRIFTFWTGDNAMTDDRRAGLDALRRLNPDLEFLLITPASLDDWLLPEHPLHPSYEHLHFVHRADYLRCYFLHFHGGGYADIKPATHPWAASFDRMDASDAWLMGYRNPVRWMTPNFTDPHLQKLMVRTSDLRLGQNAYISRPKTPISSEWWRQLNLVLDQAAPVLAQHPGDARGSDPDYPLVWTGILAQILDPLTVKYSEHLAYDDRLRPDFKAPYL